MTSIGHGAAPVRRRVALAGGVLAAILLLALLLRPLATTYTDDTFITLKYADTLRRSLSWGFFPGRPTNTATSPLNVALTALVAAVTGSAVGAAAWLAAAVYGAIGVVLALLSRRLFDGYAFGALAFLALLTNPLLLSTLGLETLLFALFFFLSVLLFLARRWPWLTVALGLLTLTRAEGVLLFLICLMVFPGPRAIRLRLALVYGLVLLPWHLFSWIHLGSVVPDTLLIKRGQEGWGGVSFPTGLATYYLRRFPAATVVSFAMAPFSVLMWRRATPAVRTTALLVGGYGLGHYLAYAGLSVPPYHWYYAPLMLASVVLGALGCGCALANEAARASSRWLIAAPASAVIIAGLLTLVVPGGFPPPEAPIHSNWATHAQYRAIGLWLRAHVAPDATVAVSGEIGTVAFYSERRLVNYFSDRNAVPTPPPLSPARFASIPIAGGALRWIVDRALALNFLWRDPEPPRDPAAYTLQLVPGRRLEPDGPDVIMTWHTSSRWLPNGTTVVLRRAGPSQRRRRSM